ncbi:hypothetical protein C4559_02320 [Candidatus Microgenomates bacterium]|nr:MAG: hypothetical protein C4559_02320 [Candidatus Microgenomates bacterium]
MRNIRETADRLFFLNPNGGGEGCVGKYEDVLDATLKLGLEKVERKIEQFKQENPNKEFLILASAGAGVAGAAMGLDLERSKALYKYALKGHVVDCEPAPNGRKGFFWRENAYLAFASLCWGQKKSIEKRPASDYIYALMNTVTFLGRNPLQNYLYFPQNREIPRQAKKPEPVRYYKNASPVSGDKRAEYAPSAGEGTSQTFNNGYKPDKETLAGAKLCSIGVIEGALERIGQIKLTDSTETYGEIPEELVKLVTYIFTTYKGEKIQNMNEVYESLRVRGFKEMLGWCLKVMRKNRLYNLKHLYLAIEDFKSKG